MSLHTDLIAAGLPVNGTAIEGVTVLFTRPLTPAELQTYEAIVNPTRQKKIDAKNVIQNIPNWTNWTQADWNNYYTNNLANGNVTGIANLAEAKLLLAKQNTIINALAKTVIALRDAIDIL